ncbi:Hypothetical predicted protein [Olea europaea subsp. europaea]|uniref:Uncharacterized protein n=1 Tax=Olea europaea subsp. europaea TaxID=158383 RepID=A0A8S0QW75_OLEEU|nr:Hypothetical predicted protein [Olea europaea subsp. europaea]
MAGSGSWHMRKAFSLNNFRKENPIICFPRLSVSFNHLKLEQPSFYLFKPFRFYSSRSPFQSCSSNHYFCEKEVINSLLVTFTHNEEEEQQLISIFDFVLW